MSVNKYKIVKSSIDKYVDIPVEIKWDFTGRDDSIDEYQENIVSEIVGPTNDFEVLRFEHKTYVPKGRSDNKTSINYEFNFYSGVTSAVTSSTLTNWVTTYRAEGFTPDQIYYYTNSFTKSFFKLDFYDTKDTFTQKNYFTIILPVQQGFTESVSISQMLPNVNIRIPKFRLDFIGDKEGFFIYWLRKQNYIDITEFYMTAKFFNGNTGNFVTMTNTPQSAIPMDFTFNGENYFYYKVELDYNDKTYEVFRSPNTLGNRVGTEQNPIKWYEYVNPE